MGYAVYEDRAALDFGVRRWAGYGVPAECDWPDCEAQIDRGLGYRCEDHGSYGPDGDPDAADDAEEVWLEQEGCGLSFCEQHRYETSQHDGIEPKPDSRRWIMHQLIDPSWSAWRNRYPDDVRAQQQQLAAVAA